jgi:hypothetical protein
MSEWIDYIGERMQCKHDIMLSSGTIVSECFPDDFGWYCEIPATAHWTDKEVLKIKITEPGYRI